MIKIWHNHLVVKVINNIVQKLQALLGLMVIWSGSIITSRQLSFCMYLWTLHRGLDITLVTLGFRSQEKIPFVTLSEESITTYMYTSVITCTSAIHYDYSRVLSDSILYLWLCTLVCGVEDLHQAFIWSTWSFTFRFQDSHIYQFTLMYFCFLSLDIVINWNFFEVFGFSKRMKNFNFDKCL